MRTIRTTTMLRMCEAICLRMVRFIFCALRTAQNSDTTPVSRRVSSPTPSSFHLFLLKRPTLFIGSAASATHAYMFPYEDKLLHYAHVKGIGKQSTEGYRPARNLAGISGSP